MIVGKTIKDVQLGAEHISLLFTDNTILIVSKDKAGEFLAVVYGQGIVQLKRNVVE